MPSLLPSITFMLLAAFHLTIANPTTTKDPQAHQLTARDTTQTLLVAYTLHTYSYGEGTNESSSFWAAYVPSTPNTYNAPGPFCPATALSSYDYISPAFRGNGPDAASLAAQNGPPGGDVVLDLEGLIDAGANCTYTGGASDVGGMVTCDSGGVLDCEVLSPGSAMLEIDCQQDGKWSESYWYSPKVSCAIG